VLSSGEFKLECSGFCPQIKHGNIYVDFLLFVLRLSSTEPIKTSSTQL
jgi:hypothetical protein